MWTVQLWLSDFFKLFFGPHEEDTPIMSWSRIALLSCVLGAMISLVSVVL